MLRLRRTSAIKQRCDYYPLIWIEATIFDTQKKVLYQVACKVEDLKEDVKEFGGAHFNLRYRQLKGKCPDLQLELDALKFDPVKEASQVKEKKKLLKLIENIEIDLVNKVQKMAGAGHNPKGCPGCQ